MDEMGGLGSVSGGDELSPGGINYQEAAALELEFEGSMPIQSGSPEVGLRVFAPSEL
jgi:hypothetical protein